MVTFDVTKWWWRSVPVACSAQRQSTIGGFQGCVTCQIRKEPLTATRESEERSCVHNNKYPLDELIMSVLQLKKTLK